MKPLLLAVALSSAPTATDFDHAVLYQSCVAYAAKDPSLCGALKPYKVITQFHDAGKKSLARPDTYDFLCLSNVLDLRMSAASIRRDRGAFAAACEAHEAAGHDDFRKETVKEACGLLSRFAQDPKQACEKVKPFVSREDALSFCESELHVFAGSPESCGQPGLGPVGQELCRANGRYRRALELKDPKRCGDSPLCRAHAGGGVEVCAPYHEQIRPRKRPTTLDKARLAEADELMRQSEAVVAELETGKCEERFTVDSLRKTWTEKRLPEDLAGALFQASAKDLERLYQCRAVSDDTPETCSELAAFEAVIPREELAEPLAMDLMCRTLYYEAVLAKALMAGKRGEVKSLCVARNKVGDRDFKLDSLDASCGIVASYNGDTAATCGALDPYFDSPTIAASCPRMLRYAAGDGTICGEFRDPIVHERCKGYEAYKKGSCGGQAYCRTLKGEGRKSCAGYEAGLKAAYCGAYSMKGFGGRLPATFERVFAILGESDPEGAAGERGKRLAALRERLQKLTPAVR